MLIYANMAIDAIQNAKKTWVNTFIKNEEVSAPLLQFVESQTLFTKQIAKSWWDVSGAASESLVSKVFSSK